MHSSFQQETAVEFGSPRLAVSTPSLDTNVLGACTFPQTISVGKIPSPENPFRYPWLFLIGEDGNELLIWTSQSMQTTWNQIPEGNLCG
jgi:hypothetical protein